MIRSGYFVGAVLLHVIVFLLVATWVIFKVPETHDDATFLPTKVAAPPPPPAPPAASGGDAVNNFEPAAQATPAPSVPSIVVTSAASAFALKSVAVAIPNLPASTAVPSGSGLSGHDTPGQNSGAGSPFGSAETGGATQLEGYLYDLKQTSDRQPTNMDPGGYHNKLRIFIANNWDSDVLRPYFKCPKPLSTSSIFVPVINAEDGPKAFGVQDEVQPNMYCVWYKVTATPPQDGTYHFVGVGDDILAVRVNGRTVLDGTLYGIDDEVRHKQTSFKMTNFNATCGPDEDFWIGTPFHANAGDQVDIDILIGEEPGGRSAYFLYIMRDESTYAKQSNGSPLLPVFQLDSKPIQPAAAPMTFPPMAAPEPWTTVSK